MSNSRATKVKATVTLAYWRNAHETYFARNGGFAPDMEVCLRALPAGGRC